MDGWMNGWEDRQKSASNGSHSPRQEQSRVSTHEPNNQPSNRFTRGHPHETRTPREEQTPKGPILPPTPAPGPPIFSRSHGSRRGGRPEGSPFPHRASSIWLLQPRILPRPSRQELVAMAALRRELGRKPSSVDKNLRVLAAELLQQHLASRSHQAGGLFSS